MSSVIVTRYPFVVSDVSGLERVTHGTGVLGVKNRWIADTLGNEGSSITAWAPVVGAVPLGPDTGGGAAGTSANAPTVALVDGQKVARFDGVDDALGAFGIAGADMASIVLVAKVRNLRASGVSAAPMRAGGTLIRGADGGLSATWFNQALSKTAVAKVGPGSGLDMLGAFRVVTLASLGETGGGAHLTVNETRTVATIEAGSAVKPNSVPFMIGVGSSGGFTELDVLEAFTVDRLLSTAETSAIYAAMKQRYGALIP